MYLNSVVNSIVIPAIPTQEVRNIILSTKNSSLEWDDIPGFTKNSSLEWDDIPALVAKKVLNTI